VRFVLLIILSFHVPLLFAEVDTITISNLPIAAEEDEQMCFDAGTGKLGKCSVAATAKPKRIAWVSKEGGGDYDDPVSAMSDLDSWCSSPSSTQRCLLRIGPGTYNLDSRLDMAAYVDIQGSGINVTVLKGDTSSATFGLVNGADSAALRNLNVTASGSGSFAAAISARNNAGFRLDHIHARITGDATFAYGLRIQNAIGSTGISAVDVDFSNIRSSSSGSNRAISVTSETTDRAQVGITNSYILGYHLNSSSNVSLFVGTTFASSQARADVNYSTIDNPTIASGNGNSTVVIYFSRIRDTTHTAAAGAIICELINGLGAASLDTCP
jgi:hypothetical protein